MADPMSHAREDCPDPARWLEVVAGAASPDVSSRLSEHAASCDACSCYLREAIRQLTDESDEAEDRFVASLKSSRPEWQRALAQRLSGRIEPPRAEPGRRPAAWWNWRLVVVGAAAAFALVLVSLAILRSRHPASVPVAQAPPSAAAPVAGSASLVAIVLEPGTTRSIERIQLLELAPTTESVKATLLFLRAPPERLSLELIDPAGRTVWSENVQMSEQDIHRGQLTVTIPASLFPAGDCRIVAASVTDQGIEKDTYAFRVSR